MKEEKSPFTKQWIIDNGIPIIEDYMGQLTIRALHYRLVASGMTNDLNHYKKVVSAMTDARWEGLVRFEAFLDHERETIGVTRFDDTDVDTQAAQAKRQIKLWAQSYSKNWWENQPVYAEVFIEKKALQGVFQDPCFDAKIALNPCKGYPSLTFLNDAAKRFSEAIDANKEPVILYFGDYDCSGEDIPRSIKENLGRLGVDVDVRRIALMEHQVREWKLPPAPTKATDSRGRTWDGIGQVELDAVEPRQLIKLAKDAIASVFDKGLFEELKEQEEEEAAQFKNILKRDFKSLLDE